MICLVVVIFNVDLLADQPRDGFLIFPVSTGGLDEPIMRPYIDRDWRFGHYEMEGLQDPLSRLLRCILQPFSLGRRARPQTEDDELVLQPLVSTV